MTDDLARLEATAQAELVRSGEASPVDLVEAAIERIEAVRGPTVRPGIPGIPPALRAARAEGRRRRWPRAWCRVAAQLEEARPWAERVPATFSVPSA